MICIDLARKCYLLANVICRLTSSVKIRTRDPIIWREIYGHKQDLPEECLFEFFFFYMESLFYDSQQEPQRIDF